MPNREPTAPAARHLGNETGTSSAIASVFVISPPNPSDAQYAMGAHEAARKSRDVASTDQLGQRRRARLHEEAGIRTEAASVKRATSARTINSS